MNYKKIIFIVLFLAIFGFLFNFGAPTAKAMTAAEIQVLIQQLQTQIAALQQQLTQIQGTPAAWCHDFNTNLRIGDGGMDGGTRPANNVDNDVAALIQALSKEGLLDYDQVVQPGSAGTSIKATYFSETVAAAVVGFQEKYASEILTPWGLKHGTGFVGKSTRAKLNALYGCGLVCAQVVTYAEDPVTGKCQSFPTPCDVPSGWQKVSSCPITPSITVISPNGGEQIKFYQTFDITWKSSGVNNAYIYLYFSDGATCKIADVPAVQGKYTEVIMTGDKCPNIPREITAGQYKILIATENENIKDFSDNYFSIVSATTTATTTLNTIENQVASISMVVSQLMENIKELMKR